MNGDGLVKLDRKEV